MDMRLATTSLLGLILATPAAAQSLDDKFWLEASIFDPKVDTKVQLSARDNPTIGTEIDFESDLDLDKDKVLPAFFGGARIGSGFSIAGEYYALHRKGGATLDRDITFKDVTYPVSAEVSSAFDTDIYRLVVGYEIVHRPTYELGIALGLHATKIKVELNGQASVGGAGVTAQTRDEDVLAPLPTIGLFGAVEPVRRLTLNGRVDYLSLKIDQYKGRLINAQAAISYELINHVSLGIAYRYVDYRLDVERERTVGRLTYNFSGPSAFLRVGF
jgi:long-subunit fatty acid transport protein